MISTPGPGYGDSRGRETTTNRVRILFRMLARDFSIALRNIYLNKISGSFMVPQVARMFLYRLAGMRIDSFQVGPKCRIEGSPRNIRIGSGTYFNVDCYLEAVGSIDIGEGCAIGMQVMVVTSDHSRDEYGRWESEAVGHSVTIGDRVWIGARATILPGVTIGDDAIVAAGAVVTRDCAAAGMYAGVPARLVRELAIGSVPA